jgi:hypothetical protein
VKSHHILTCADFFTHLNKDSFKHKMTP